MSLARVAIVSPFPPPLGGMAHQANILAQYLENDGVTVHRIPTNSHRNQFPMRDVSAVRNWRSVSPKVDVVNIHTCCYASYLGTTIPIIWLAKRQHKRIVVTYKGGTAPEVFRRLGQWGLRWLRMADLVTVPSGYLHNVFSDLGVETRIVNNLLEETVNGEEPRDMNTLAPKILITRGLGAYYNISCAIRAFQIVQNQVQGATLLIAGSGGEWKKLRGLVNKLGVPNINFLGHQDRSQIHALYRTSDISLNSSNVDNFPGAILEACAFGVPIVTTDAGGIPYMVKHQESARMVQINDHEGLAREMMFCLENPVIARKQAVAAQSTLMNYRWDAVRDSWMKALTPDQG